MSPLKLYLAISASNFENYKCYINCRSNEPSKKRGGLAVFIKRQISTGITLVDKSMTEIMWFKLNASKFLTDCHYRVQ
jgi:hypothetical protein